MLHHERDPDGRLINPEIPPKMSYWLIPGESHFMELQGIISALAERFNGPIFEPHLTIFSGQFGPGDAPEKLLQSVKKLSQPITLECTGLSFSDSYTHSCYLTCNTLDSMTDMTECFREGSSISCDYQLQSHISLFYGMLSKYKRETIKRLLTIPISVSFDRLWAVSNTAKVSKRSDVESWRLVEEVNLVGG
jgi:Cyclic phosphodiesterase-like protein